MAKKRKKAKGGMKKKAKKAGKKKMTAKGRGKAKKSASKAKRKAAPRKAAKKAKKAASRKAAPKRASAPKPTTSSYSENGNDTMTNFTSAAVGAGLGSFAGSLGASAASSFEE